MNKNHIFIDTNVLIGAFLGKENDVKCLKFLSFPQKTLDNF